MSLLPTLKDSTNIDVTRPEGFLQREDNNRGVILLVVVLVTMAAYFFPFLLLGSHSYITIHDNLDGEFVVNYLLVKTGTALGGTTVPNIMNGLPRAALPSGLNVTVLLFYVFPPRGPTLSISSSST